MKKKIAAMQRCQRELDKLGQVEGCGGSKLSGEPDEDQGRVDGRVNFGTDQSRCSKAPSSYNRGSL
jgi:hypothetical protein